VATLARESTIVLAGERPPAPVAPARACWAMHDRADVPPDDDWLGEAERRVLDRLLLPKRRADWRVGRWAAKHALARCLTAAGPETALARMQVLAAPDGAPEPALDGAGLRPSLSLSHSGEYGFAVACLPALPLGCDIERVEPRSPAFVRDYFTAREAADVAQVGPEARALVATLFWSAKESALKLRREGLRADTRSVEVRLTQAVQPRREWEANWHGRFRVLHQGGEAPLHGCWWRTGDFVCTVAMALDCDPPEWNAPDARTSWSASPA